MPHYESLLAMGFNKGAAAEALRQANNDIIAAIQVGNTCLQGTIQGIPLYSKICLQGTSIQ